MASHQNQPPGGIEELVSGRDLGGDPGFASPAVRDVKQRIDAGIAGHDDMAAPIVFLAQVGRGFLGGRKHEIGDRVDCDPIEFLRPGPVEVERTQTGFDMADRDTGVKCRQRRRHCRCRIAMHQHEVRLFARDHLAHPDDDLGGDIPKRLARRHDVEIDIRAFIKGGKHLVEHLPVLAGDADNLVHQLAGPDLAHHRHHLDAFRPGAKHRHDALLQHASYRSCSRQFQPVQSDT